MMVLGPPLAWHKASWGKQLTWCGLDYTFTEHAVTVTIPEDKLGDLNALTTNMMSHNVLSIGVLRTYVGKLQSIGSLLYAIRAFFVIVGSASGATGWSPRRSPLPRAHQPFTAMECSLPSAT